MKNNQSDSPLFFGIKDFEVLSYHTDKPKTRFNFKNAVFNIGIEPEVNLKSETVSIGILIEVLKDEKSKQSIGKIKTQTLFHIKGMDFLLNDNNKIVLPEPLAITLISIAFSTTRGALAVKSSGDALSGIILPLIEPKQLYDSSKLKGELITKE
jgi:hypothetical protein